MSRQHLIVVMGVTSSGKSSIGRRLAERLNAEFAEGDDYHPPSNIAKMSKGEPLDDADRAPWLAALADDIERFDREGRSAVFTCSALKKIYRDRLRQGSPKLLFVFLDGTGEIIGERMAARMDHFMPPSLLPSQLATLERPDDEPGVLIIDNARPIDTMLDDIIARLDMD
ncbi:MAG: gluconokinase [Geminicoccaceae bacterium]|nr:gluconokinase [Geminicoccaceae bacterium]